MFGGKKIWYFFVGDYLVDNKKYINYKFLRRKELGNCLVVISIGNIIFKKVLFF